MSTVSASTAGPVHRGTYSIHENKERASMSVLNKHLLQTAPQNIGLSREPFFLLVKRLPRAIDCECRIVRGRRKRLSQGYPCERFWPIDGVGNWLELPCAPAKSHVIDSFRKGVNAALAGLRSTVERLVARTNLGA